MKRILSLAVFTLFVSVAFAQQSTSVIVSNPSEMSKTDEPVVISLKEYSDIRSALVTSDGQEIPCQLDDLDQDDTFDELCFLVNLKGKETKTYKIQLFDEGEPRPYPARVFAEMLIRNDKVKEKNKHNNFIESITARGDCNNSYNIQHHHGVDFESELNVLEHFGLNKEGALVREAVDASLAANVRTPEIQVEGGAKYGTREVGEWIVNYIQNA